MKLPSVRPPLQPTLPMGRLVVRRNVSELSLPLRQPYPGADQPKTARR
jgi:hypothetical protein